MKSQGGPNRKTPPVGIFSTSISRRTTKLATHMQRPNTETPAKFQGYSPIITPFTPHMCDVQGHYANNVNFIIYLYDHIRMCLCCN